MLAWLRQARRVRRDAEPELELIGELFRIAAPHFVCPECQSTGLQVRPAPQENDEDWGMARSCEGCGKPIPRERLEIFPNTRLCVACQSSDDRGVPGGVPEYCPRCGNVMAMKQTRTAGVTRYVMACPQCRR